MQMNLLPADFQQCDIFNNTRCLSYTISDVACFPNNVG